jgi:hypothetical protein
VVVDFTLKRQVHVGLSLTDKFTGWLLTFEMWVQRDYRAIAVVLLEDYVQLSRSAHLIDLGMVTAF